jgi:DNA-directed RNA polymerase subunit N (RpoN/RPB10)
MEQEIYVLPVRCKGCGTVFDLWRVLQEQESKKGVLRENQLDKFLRQSLCAKCKNAVRLELNEELNEELGEELNSEITEEAELENSAQDDEYEIMLDL